MITTTYLEISKLMSPRQAPAGDGDDKEVHLEKPEAHAACAGMYSRVGKAYFWDLYRIGWTDADWARYLRHPGTEISFICDRSGTRIGYLELRTHPDDSVEIVIFGLLPDFTGRGFGRSSLELAVGRAFELGAARVWLRTCSLDHSGALRLYYSCGFRLLRKEVADYLRLDKPPEHSEPSGARFATAEDPLAAGVWIK